ncbi:MAG: hypothetical protein J6K12_03975 [Clostridia bacterium]|nr:hypothetical protein [Clostridia bacterium]
MKNFSGKIKMALCVVLAAFMVVASAGCAKKQVSNRDFKGITKAVENWVEAQSETFTTAFVEGFYGKYESNEDWVYDKVYDNNQTPIEKLSGYVINKFDKKSVHKEDCVSNDEGYTVVVTLKTVDFADTLELIYRGTNQAAHLFQNLDLSSDEYPCQINKTLDYCLTNLAENETERAMAKSAFLIDYLAYGEQPVMTQVVLHLDVEKQKGKWVVCAVNGTEFDDKDKKDNNDSEDVLRIAVEQMFRAER